MLVRHAREVARRWVHQEAVRIRGFAGAFFHGSTNSLADDDLLPPASDMDVMVVLDVPEPPTKLGKFNYADVLLEASYLSNSELRSAEHVLGQYHLAPSFRTASVIADPTGHLTKMQADVSREFARRLWVRKRCEHARDKVLANCSVNAAAPLHDQGNSWLFPTGVTTHVILTAGLRNPTVRKRYVAVRELLQQYGHGDFHEELLDLLGCADMTPERVAQHLASMTEAFDTASGVIRTPYQFASDFNQSARPIAVDGSRELIEAGLHREAIFWIAATYCRCRIIFQNDAPDALVRHDPGLHALLEDLGIASYADRERRCEQTREFMPRVWSVAEAIIAANREITG